jgi:hypothetical protein
MTIGAIPPPDLYSKSSRLAPCPHLVCRNSTRRETCFVLSFFLHQALGLSVQSILVIGVHVGRLYPQVYSEWLALACKFFPRGFSTTW